MHPQGHSLDDPFKSCFQPGDDFASNDRFWDDADLKLPDIGDVDSSGPEMASPDQVLSIGTGPRGKHSENKMAQAAAVLLRVIQEEDELTIKLMQERAGVDSKRIYDFVNGFLWAGILSRDPGSRVYSYKGERGPHPIDLVNLGRKLKELRELKKQKEAEVANLHCQMEVAMNASCFDCEIFSNF
jgi:hypothetical protein